MSQVGTRTPSRLAYAPSEIQRASAADFCIYWRVLGGLSWPGTGTDISTNTQAQTQALAQGTGTHIKFTALPQLQQGPINTYFLEVPNRIAVTFTTTATKRYAQTIDELVLQALLVRST